MKTSKKSTKLYYHLVVDILTYDTETQEYKLWFKQTLSSVKTFRIWKKGFFAGVDSGQFPLKRILGNVYKRYLPYPPKY